LQFAEDNNIAFIESSALNGTNVEIGFNKIISEIYRILEKNK